MSFHTGRGARYGRRVQQRLTTRARGLFAWVIALCALPACDERGAPADGTSMAVEQPPSAREEAPPRYAGSDTCLPCHEAQATLWKGSHHDLAMQTPNTANVLGNFEHARFAVDDETFVFRRRGAEYWVDVSSQGDSRSYLVRYLLGVEPLQQLVVDVGRGHLQALSVAWDARPESEGGQRWFFLNPDDHVSPGGPLHWLGAQYNYNRMCADCHSTGVRKGYRRDTRRYQTSAAEIDVACEACHGPSSRHVAAARAGVSDAASGTRRLVSSKRRWTFARGASIAHLEGQKSQVEEQACAPCHSRRAALVPHGDGYHDRYRLSLLEDPLYFPDGQVRGEVYVYGSFLQSRMHAAGVTCSDCHEPHSLALKAPGNALCHSCHRPEVFDAPSHHLHEPGSAGAQCVACHMPERTFMVLDGRRDHRFGVPRPDLSERIGSPDPCTSCHTERTTRWAAAQLRRHDRLRTEEHFATPLHAARAELSFVAPQLAKLVDDEELPPIVRATALTQLARTQAPELLGALRGAAHEPSPLLRRAAAEALAQLPLALRESAGSRLLSDPVRSVRIEAAQKFIAVEISALSAATRQALAPALREHAQSATYRADAGDGLVSLANLRLVEGRPEKALALLSEAQRRDPSYTAAYVNQADVLRGLGREARARAVLQRGLSQAADPAPLEHALGLSLVRSGRHAQALEHLEAAHRARPQEARYAFVYAVALFDGGQRDRAVQVLQDALARAPANPRLLSTLARYSERLGRTEEARVYEARLARLREGR